VSINDSIAGFATGTYTVTRRLKGTFTSGKYVPNASPSTFSVSAVIQPATDLQRVVGGKDLREGVENQRLDDVRMMHCATELYMLSATHDPDTISYDGDSWTVFRVEPHDFSGTRHWMAVITRRTDGAA
jgi:hypothetical protein